MDALNISHPNFYHHQGLFQGTVHQGPDCQELSTVAYHCPLPLSIALAITLVSIPEQGLLHSSDCRLFISLLGGSRVQIGGPTCSLRCHHLWHHRPVWHGWIWLFSTLMAGYACIMGLLRFVDLIKFIPKTITLGFTLGIAVGIVAGQIKFSEPWDEVGASWVSGKDDCL